jgi:hypothetical protein
VRREKLQWYVDSNLNGTLVIAGDWYGGNGIFWYCPYKWCEVLCIAKSVTVAAVSPSSPQRYLYCDIRHLPQEPRWLAVPRLH